MATPFPPVQEALVLRTSSRVVLIRRLRDLLATQFAADANLAFPTRNSNLMHTYKQTLGGHQTGRLIFLGHCNATYNFGTLFYH